MTLDLRCSALPLAFICPGSIRPPEVRVDGVCDAADNGTAVHRGLALMVGGTAPDAAQEQMLAEFPSENRAEIVLLFWAGVRMWQKHISEWMPSAEAERFLVIGTDDTISGHMDACSVSPPRAVVLDWKSGRKDTDYHHQGFGYAVLILAAHQEVDEVTVHFAWLRTGELESYTVSRARADSWGQELKAQVIDWDGVYHNGPHCAHCPRNHDCPAVTAMVRRDAAMFADGAPHDLTKMDGPVLAVYVRKLKGLASLG